VVGKSRETTMETENKEREPGVPGAPKKTPLRAERSETSDRRLVPGVG